MMINSPNIMISKKTGSKLPCGDKRDRTADLLNAIQALSQLSYIPDICFKGTVNLSENRCIGKGKADHFYIIFVKS